MSRESISPLTRLEDGYHDTMHLEQRIWLRVTGQRKLNDTAQARGLAVQNGGDPFLYKYQKVVHAERQIRPTLYHFPNLIPYPLSGNFIDQGFLFFFR